MGKGSEVGWWPIKLSKGQGTMPQPHPTPYGVFRNLMGVSIYLFWSWPGGGGARPWPSGAGGEESGADLDRGLEWGPPREPGLESPAMVPMGSMGPHGSPWASMENP